VYGLGPSGVLALDDWEAAGPGWANRSRAFDLAGRNVWVDCNRIRNTGSAPGGDGENIVYRFAAGTPVDNVAWEYLPCAELGGDALNVFWLDKHALSKQSDPPWHATPAGRSLLPWPASAPLPAGGRRGRAALKALATDHKLLRPAPSPIDFSTRLGRPGASSRGGCERMAGRVPIRN
jgi:hypothetical protein